VDPGVPLGEEGRLELLLLRVSGVGEHVLQALPPQPRGWGASVSIPYR